MNKIIYLAFAAMLLSIQGAAAQAKDLPAECWKGKLVFRGNDAIGVDVPAWCPGMTKNHTFPGAKSSCPHGFVTLEPTRDRLTFLKLDLSQARPAVGIGSLAASTWLLDPTLDPSPLRAEASRERP